MQNRPLRILIVEDSSYMAGALAHLLSTLPTVALVGQATNRREALNAATSQRPDLVILDLRIPDTSDDRPNPNHGLETLRELRSLMPPPNVLVFSSLPEQPWLGTAARAGAVGFLNKDTSTEAIISALQAVSNGMHAFTLEQLQLLQAASPALTPREQEVLELLNEGLSNQEIAERLRISIGTARKHVERLCDAFGVTSRGHVVAAARRTGVVG